MPQSLVTGGLLGVVGQMLVRGLGLGVAGAGAAPSPGGLPTRGLGRATAALLTRGLGVVATAVGVTSFAALTSVARVRGVDPSKSRARRR